MQHRYWEIITPQGVMGIIGPKGVFDAAHGLQTVRSMPASTLRGANNTHDPEGWGVIITFL